MPTEADHIALANRNHDALVHLLTDPSKYSEWIATSAFYKAVQVVEAVFTAARVTTYDHKSRHEKLKTRYEEAWKHYRILWQASCIARYLRDNDSKTSYRQFADYMPPEQIEKKLIRKRLRPVEQLMVSHLSQPAADALSRIAS